MKGFLAGALALCTASAASAAPLPSRHPETAQDLGRLREVAGAETSVSATVALTLDSARMQRLVTDLYDRQGPHYRQFLSSDAFREQFAPSAETVARVSADLREEGLAVELVNGTLLRVTGSPAQVEHAFGVELHAFQIPTREGMEVVRFHAPAQAPKLRASWSGVVDAVLGLDTRPRLRPHTARTAKMKPSVRPATASPNTPNPPGLWTVTDFADYYDVNPLYAHGDTGRGTTIGIVTLAALTPSDVFTYWSAIGLNVNSKRLTIVNIDNGPGAPSDASGSDETTLDVEQSGGIAPGANIIVYQAPNTDQGFVDAFAQAMGDNRADSISCSWGEWEEFDSLTDVNNPYNPRRTIDELHAMENLFIQGALQGQSLFAAAGDSGAYDVNSSLYPGDPFFGEVPYFSLALSVDSPASDPYITAAGGTTLPGEQSFYDTTTGDLIDTINIAHERAWGWEYLNGLCSILGYDPVDCGIFPVGGGGGVSLFFGVPDYQQGISGLATSAPKQSVIDYTQTPPQVDFTLPAHVAGRNLPDISFNADPDTGYIILYTSDQTGFGELAYIGGTSFVAPQLAGVTALVDAYAGGRVGLLNYPLYELAQWGALYSGRNPAARDITDGNNEYYKAAPGYDQATGLGVLDVANFAAWFR